MNNGMYNASFIIFGVLATLFGVGLTAVVFESGSRLVEAEQTDFPVVTFSEVPEDDLEAISIPTITAQSGEVFSIPFERGACPTSPNNDAPRLLAPVDKDYNLRDHVPNSLVEIRKHIATKDNRNICLDSTAATFLKLMLDDAKTAGYEIVVTSGYRSHNTQAMLRHNSELKHGDPVHDRVAEAGHSEHQLGMAADFASRSNGFVSAGRSFGNTDDFRWLEENAYRYGFVLSYPEGYEDLTGYIYEPWHWRFVGPENVEWYENLMFEG
jgi:LAS superfamily LD-carboxypeptidase LdcB